MKKKLKKKPEAPAHQAYTRYAGAERSRLTADWLTSATSANADIRRDLPLLRQRSRDLFGNNEYGKRFSELIEQNIIGPSGITYQAILKDARGEQDEQANTELERAFREWSGVGECDVTGGMSFPDLCELVVTTCAVDGECFIRKIRGYPNKYGFALQIIDTDRVEECYQQTLPDGEINMSIELDSWERPRAYHVLSRHPGDYVQNYRKYERVRIPAEDMIHLFRRKRVGQIRGLPWAHAVMSRVKMLGAYEEAEVIAARVGASKMGFYKKTEMGEMPIIEPKKGERQDSQEPEDKGRLVQEAAPATFEELPYGYDFQSFTPEHPAGNYAPFVKGAMRGVASGLNVSYSSLSGDLESVNYSSIRAGLLDERDSWRKLQRWFIGSFVQPVDGARLEQSFLSGKIAITPQQYEQAFTPKWQARGWDWVDPLKDAQADSEALGNGLTTRTKILAARGEDFEDTMKQLAAEQKIAHAYGVECGTGRKVPEREPENPEREELRLVKSA